MDSAQLMNSPLRKPLCSAFTVISFDVPASTITLMEELGMRRRRRRRPKMMQVSWLDDEDESAILASLLTQSHSSLSPD
uniref:Uncharacterized protein n=1 Tax=Salix viminalis TaxID=40686 RepID=A0A6N2LJW8_SALVM